MLLGRLERPGDRTLAGDGRPTQSTVVTAIAANGPMARESRLRPRAAAAAVLAGVLLLVAGVVLLLGPQPKVDEATLVLIVDNKRAALGIVYGVVSALGSVAI